MGNDATYLQIDAEDKKVAGSSIEPAGLTAQVR
jgi:hypothetical protein